MSLRVKIELVLVAMIALVIALGYWFQREVVLPGLIPLETEQARGQMGRCFQGLRDHVTRVNVKCRDWADAIDLHRFAPKDGSTGGNDALIAAMAEQRVDMAYAVNPEGAVLWGAVVRPGTNERVVLEEIPETAWPKTFPLFRLNPDDPVSGIFPTHEAPLIVASWPVPDKSRPGAVLGCLVLGKFLTEDIVRSIQESTGVPFRIWPLNRPIPRAWYPILARVLKPFWPQVEELPDGEQLEVYGTYPDLHGQPALLFRHKMQRGVFSKATSAVEWGLLAQLAIGLVSLLVMVALLQFILVRPLASLSRHAAKITRTQDLSKRLRLKRDDEIGMLANEFDAMLDNLEKDRADRRLAEEALRENQERFELAVNGANDGLWDWDLRANAIYFSPRWKSMLGYRGDEIAPTRDAWFDLIHPQDLGAVQASLDAHFRGRCDTHFECEYRARHKDGAYLWMLCRGLVIMDANGQPARMAGSQTDITERKRAEEQLAHDAFHDALTQLPNRALFLDRLQQAAKQARRFKDYKFAMLLLDLDRFKVVNDGLGHIVGDKLLVGIARRLETCLRDDTRSDRFTDTVARFGGDEFVILLNDIRDNSDAIRVATRIHEVLKVPFQIEGYEVFSSASIGIAFSTTGYEHPEEFLRSADTAMYRAKAQGKACYEIFDTEMYSQAMDRINLETELRRGLDQLDLKVHYQPIVDFSTGRIYGFEALARWPHPTRGMVSPLDFIPLAEETGIILKLGQWVLHEACLQAAQWRKDIPEARDLVMSVNLSPKQFQQAELVESVELVLNETGLEPAALKLEITESAVMHNVEWVSATLDRLRTMGVQLSMDDFGTGYSSLSSLHRFPIQILKIDQSFVKGLPLSLESVHFIQTIMVLANNLNMAVVAEGIETAEQYEQIKGFGCQYGQGFFISRALPPDQAAELLRTAPKW